MPGSELDVLHAFSFKVASRCNLDCSYCYVYNKADTSWRDRPKRMPEAVFRAGLDRIVELCRTTGRDQVSLTFHGGEPCLIGVETFRRWCRLARQVIEPWARLRLVIQTNGTLITPAFAEAFRDFEVDVGVSLDGPAEIHDAVRVDHRGRGSHDRVLRGLEELRRADVGFAILSVLPLGVDGGALHRHFVSLGAAAVSYLMPDFTHDTVGVVRERFGPTPCADVLVQVFDEWWDHGDVGLRVEPFWSMSKMILGGDSNLDFFGSGPLGFLFVEADGTIEGLDVLRVCADGMAATPYNVLTQGFDAFCEGEGFHRDVIFSGRPVPGACAGCPELKSCAGGYLPHRHSQARGFDNPTIWCADLKVLFAHLRHRLGVDHQETELRRRALKSLPEAAWTPRAAEAVQ